MTSPAARRQGGPVSAKNTFLTDAVGEYSYEGELAAALPTAVLVFGLGALLIVLGALAAAQFWRAGEPLGSGESFT